jgi:oligoribonuclease
MTPPSLVWIDVETTDFDETTGHLLEVGAILTDWDLVPIAERSWVLHFDGPVSPVIADMHGPEGSGLLAACARSVNDPEDVELYVRGWLRKHGCDPDAKDKPLLAGRNVHFDRRWLRRHLPRVEASVSHRSVDVSTLRLAFNAWAGLATPKPEGGHRSLVDLHADLATARACRALLGAYAPGGWM